MLDKITTFGVNGIKAGLLLLALFLGTSSNLFAQGEISMHSNGKIYLVIGVLSAIFLGIIFFLILLERKLNKLEKQINNNNE